MVAISKKKSEGKDSIDSIFSLDTQFPVSDPFLFCAFHQDAYPKGNAGFGPSVSLEGRQLGMDFSLKDGFRMYHGYQVPGFPVHPHRGFETVTIVSQGVIDHADSLGGAGRYGDGDVQWMTAGSGIQHAEMFPLLHQDRENHLELFQVWLNLPAAKKMVQPHFSMFWRDDIPVVNEKGVYVRIIAGSLGNKKALKPPPDSYASDPDAGVTILTIRLDEGAVFRLPVDKAGLNRMIYFYSGSLLLLGDQTLKVMQGARLSSLADISVQARGSSAKILLLQGLPQNQKVVQRGPFVMNSLEEIEEAYRDYQKTHFGGWPWMQKDPVHAKEAGRFAQYPDGSIVKPEKT